MSWFDKAHLVPADPASDDQAPGATLHSVKRVPNDYRT